MSDHKELYSTIFDLIEKHDTWMQNTINLIASENVSSPAVRSAIVSDFRDRYAEGWPGERVYAGCKFMDEVELITIDLAKKLYKADVHDALMRTDFSVVAPQWWDFVRYQATDRTAFTKHQEY